MAVFALGVVVAPVLGPTLGGKAARMLIRGDGLFTSTFRLASFAVIMISRYVQNPSYVKEAKPGRFDDWTRPACRVAGLLENHSG